MWSKCVTVLGDQTGGLAVEMEKYVGHTTNVLEKLKCHINSTLCYHQGLL